MKWKIKNGGARVMHETEDGRFAIDHSGIREFTLYDNRYPHLTPGHFVDFYRTLAEAKAAAAMRVVAEA